MKQVCHSYNEETEEYCLLPWPHMTSHIGFLNKWSRTSEEKIECEERKSDRRAAWGKLHTDDWSPPGRPKIVDVGSFL